MQRLQYLSLNKRQKIVIASVILSLGLFSTQLVPFYLTQRFIVGLAVLSYVLSLWALWTGINRLKAIVLLILPTLFTLAITSYYFLLPVRWLTRLSVAIAFGLTYYTLLLSQNVFNVSSVRTIPLYRVASTVILVLTLLTAYFLFNVIYSFHLFFIYNGLLVFILAFPLVMQFLWSIEMESVSSLILVYSLAIALIVGEIAMALSFWPINQAMASLVLTTSLYITLGVSNHFLREKLNKKVVWEYVFWGFAIFLIAILTTSWKG